MSYKNKIEYSIFLGIVGTILLVLGVIFGLNPEVFNRYIIPLILLGGILFIVFIINFSLGISDYLMDKNGHKGYCRVVSHIERRERSKHRGLRVIHFFVVEYVSDSGKSIRKK